MEGEYFFHGEPSPGTVLDEDDFKAVFYELKKMTNAATYNHHESIKAFESAFSRKMGNRFAVAVSSCAVGIDMVLKSLNLTKEDEVISCAINFPGTHLAILNTGAKLILSEPDKSLNLDVENVLNKITKHTKAIVVTHMNGLSCNMDPLYEQLRDRNILILEDAARSCGARYKGQYIGCNSQAAVFSFQYKKHITTLGEGGMILTNNEALYKKMLEYRSFGMGTSWGTNYKLTAVQAAVGISQLAKLDRLIEKRRYLAQERDGLFTENLTHFQLPKDDKIYYNSYYTYTILTPQDWNGNMRDCLMDDLKENYGIGTVIANKPTYQTNSYIRRNVNVKDTPLADDLGEHILCLPIHPTMTAEENRWIADRFIECVQKVF